jgi:hypothetical protein
MGYPGHGQESPDRAGPSAWLLALPGMFLVKSGCVLEVGPGVMAGVGPGESSCTLAWTCLSGVGFWILAAAKVKGWWFKQAMLSSTSSLKQQQTGQLGSGQPEAGLPAQPPNQQSTRQPVVSYSSQRVGANYSDGRAGLPQYCTSAVSVRQPMRLLCASWSSFLCLHMGGGLHGFGEMICFGSR